jgi:hypothetical protein
MEKYKKKYLHQIGGHKNTLYQQFNKLNDDEKYNFVDYLHNYFSESDEKKVCGKNIIKYLKKCEKDLNKINIKLLIDQSNPVGFHCGSGSVLSDLYQLHGLDDESMFIYCCLQNIMNDFWKDSKNTNTAVTLYHNLYKNTKKDKELRDLIHTILNKYFTVKWNKSSKQAITIEIPDDISKKDYNLFVKKVKELLSSLINKK